MKNILLFKYKYKITTKNVTTFFKIKKINCILLFNESQFVLTLLFFKLYEELNNA